jgi:rhodanese-related sulfurtransferase
MAREEVVVIDVRDYHSFVAGHIPGALQIPEGFIAGEVPHLPRDRPIVTYCA